MNQFTYIGTELELFSEAKNWKNYVKNILRKYIKGEVLEVGAGIGSNTLLLSRSQYSKWMCLEPDYKLFDALEQSIASQDLRDCFAFNGTIDSLSYETLFDAILYIDVLEHIESDREEVIKASRHLKPDGHLIILGPAHQWLFTPFDTAIGHYRRYNKAMLKAIVPNDLETVKLAYLDCVGLLASLGNKLVLKQSQPSLKQIKTWDNYMVPLSQKIDPAIGYTLGKSVLFVGRKKS
jgi:SAM-dependent methyltransferase